MLLILFILFTFKSIISYESLYFCASIHPLNIDAIVKNCTLKRGKWIDNILDYKTIDPPNNITINIFKNVTICASGKQWAPSGTEGYFFLGVQKLDQFIKIWWNIKLIGPNSYNSISSDKLHVDKISLDVTWIQFDIKYVT